MIVPSWSPYILHSWPPLGKVRVKHVPVAVETRVGHHVVYLPAHSGVSLLLLLLLLLLLPVLLLLLVVMMSLSHVVLLRSQRAGRLVHLC